MIRFGVKNTFLSFTCSEDEESRRAAIGSSCRAKSLDSVFEGTQERLDRLRNCDTAQLVRLDTLAAAAFPKQWTSHTLNSFVISSAATALERTKWFRVNSCSSVSTMAPEDANDCAHECRDKEGVSMRTHRQKLHGNAFNQMSEDRNTRSCKVLSQRVGLAHRNTSGSSSGVSEDIRHCQVPRNVNLAEEFAAQRTNQKGLPTTLMIRNIPSRMTQQDIIRELEALGFAETFDFFYAPMDKFTKCTVGYAFVNFLQPDIAERCQRVMEHHYFQTRGKKKQARVSVAHIQGLAANIRHYQNAAVNTAYQHGPIILTVRNRY